MVLDTPLSVWRWNAAWWRDVPLVADLVRGLEDPVRRLREAGNAVQRPAADDLLHERGGVEAPVLGQALEGLVDEGQHPLAVRVLDPVLEGQREDRLDARGAAGDHRDRAGRRDRRHRGVPHRPHVAIDRVVPVRERTALLGQLAALVVRGLLHEEHEAVGELDGLLAVVRESQREEEIGPAHDARARYDGWTSPSRRSAAAGTGSSR